MRKWSSFVALAVLGGAPAAEALAQEPGAPDSVVAQLRALQRRLDSLERVIAELRAAGRDTATAGDELAALRAAARAAVPPSARRDSVAQGTSRTGNLQLLNPEISVTGDFVGHYTAPADEDRFAGAVPREFEFSFQAALDPYTRAKVFIAREEEFEIAGFPEEEGEEEEGHGFEIEEGYMYWVGLPGGFGAKIGKFRQDIGLYNRWHTHALFEVERPLVTTMFLGEDGLIQTGAQISLPALSVGPSTQNLTIEVASGTNDALFEGGNELSYLGRFVSFWDVSASTYVQFGATGVYGENDETPLTTKMLGLDVSLRWAPPNRALFQTLYLKGEWYLAEKDFGAERLVGSGGYLQANYRAGRRWILGARADYVDDYGPNGEIVQLAPSLSWWQSEWVRLRLQLNHLRPEGGPGNNTLLFQAVWAFGPHKHETY